MPIDWAHVNWLYVIVLTVFVLFSNIVGNLISFKHSGFAALLSAIIFAAIFVFWSYYPHPQVPLPTSFSGQTSPVAAVTPTVQPAPAPMAKPAETAAPAAPTAEPATTPAPATPATKPAPAPTAPAPSAPANPTTMPAPASPPPAKPQ